MDLEILKQATNKDCKTINIDKQGVIDSSGTAES